MSNYKSKHMAVKTSTITKHLRGQTGSVQDMFWHLSALANKKGYIDRRLADLAKDLNTSKATAGKTIAKLVKLQIIRRHEDRQTAYIIRNDLRAVPAKLERKAER